MVETSPALRGFKSHPPAPSAEVRGTTLCCLGISGAEAVPLVLMSFVDCVCGRTRRFKYYFQTFVVRRFRMKEILVTRKGQVTIPVEYRKKYKVDKGARMLVEDTADGLLLKPIQNLEEQAGIDAGKYDVKKLKMLLDRVREEWR